MHYMHDTIMPKFTFNACTLRVTTHVTYFLLSPMIMTLLRKGTSLLMWSSMGTGAMFSPPEVMISSEGKGNPTKMNARLQLVYYYPVLPVWKKDHLLRCCEWYCDLQDHHMNLQKICPLQTIGVLSTRR